MVINQPAIVLDVSRSERTSAIGPLSGRVEAFVSAWSQHTGQPMEVACQIVHAPDEHVGLGVGTQLGLSVALALDTLGNRLQVSLEERARSVRRGLRSAIGTYGFDQGGLIVEDGKSPDETLGKLHERVSLPSAWRLLLVRLRGVRGLAGDAEKSAFSRAETAPAVQRRLRNELFEGLLPAAQEGDFSGFSESVYRYGTAAGECFAEAQEGPFLSREIAELVQFCRNSGVAGVGQSSWGPTVYSWFRDEASAIDFERKLHSQPNFDADTLVTSVCDSGAKLVS